MSLISENAPKITDLVNTRARSNPDRPALVMPDETFLSYGDLAAAISRVSRFLIERGLVRSKRIAVIMPDGPEMIVALLAISHVAVYVPLNPKLSSEELANQLKIIGADAVMVRQDALFVTGQDNHDAVLPVITMHPYKPGSQSSFAVDSSALPINETVPIQLPRGDDVAIILTTSGTTSDPKVVPLTHANLCWAARNNADFFSMGENDRCLNVIPQYHIYSIVASILGSLAAGGSVICTESFRPDEFVDMLGRLTPTWYAASPAVHQAIMRYIVASQFSPVRHFLSCIRSGGAPLSTKLQKQLEQCFGVMVVQGYGLTETSAMGTRNPPIPGRIKPGSAGVVTGCEMQILGEDGHALAHDQVGAILIKGPGVTSGYEAHQDSSATSFVNGWFVTGDEGFLDEDGYLFISGRTKELINRGGEKFSPYEVEHALSDHPDVVDVAVYAVPHERLGEVPMAMVVLRAEAGVEPAHLKSFLRDKIALHKVPVEVIPVREIPRNPSGKVQRHLLSKQYVRVTSQKRHPPGPRHDHADDSSQKSEVAEIVEQTWQKVLGLKDLRPDDDFFALGGDSLLFAELVVELERATGIKIPLASIVNKWTIAQQNDYLSNPEKESPAFRFLFPIRSTGTLPPLFCIHNNTGSSLSFRPLADHMDIEQPIWAFWLNPEEEGLSAPLSLVELARAYIKEMQEVCAHGPYLVTGHSMGGKIAFEMARQLQAKGEKVALLAMIDTWEVPPRPIRKRIEKTETDIRKFIKTPYGEMLPYLLGKLTAELKRPVKKFRKRFETKPPPTPVEILNEAGVRYQLDYYDGPVVYFKAETDDQGRSQISLQEWLKNTNNMQIILSPGGHGQMIKEPHVAEFARKLTSVIQAALNADR